MSTELTPQQRVAVAHRGSSVVLASGAGCGKTHVLTARYLSHLEADGAAVPQVVAITFTERAAREMRGRIRSQVEVKARTDPAWQQHLRDLETAPVTTIHGFCGSLLRQFAVPAGLDPAFEQLDDVLAANIRTEAITASLHALLSSDEGDSRDALRELVVLFGYPAVVEAVDGLLLNVDRPAWDAWLARRPEEIAADWCGARRAELLPRWVQYLCAASPKVAGCLTLLERVQSPTPQVMANVARLLAEVPRLHEAKDLPAAVAELTELAKVGRSGKKDWPDAGVYEAVKEAFEDFRAELPKRFELFTAETKGVEEVARVGQLFLRVAGAADDEYRRRKRRGSALDFQDLLVLARDLLRDNAEVRDAVRARFRFLLLDELQDTDPVQMELVRLVCGPGVEAGALFAVGDHKQSIYRFRGAEVELFRNLRASVAPAGRLALTRNYRSQPDVLGFVNALFARRVPDYEPLEAHHAAVAEGNVELLWAAAGPTPAPTLQGEAARGFAGGAGGLPREAASGSQREVGCVADLRAAEADAIARRIVQLLEDPTPRVLGRDGPRRVERRDVALLFRSMTHAHVYEAALRRHGLDYYLVGGRAFFAQQEVYDLLNLLRAVENPHDATSLVGVLRSPFVNVSDEAVFLLATHADGPWAGLLDAGRLAALPADQRPAAQRAARLVAKWRDVKDRLPIARLLGVVLADTGFDAALQFEFLGDRKLANLWKLVELARTFDRSGLFGLPEFVARLGDLVARQPREEQAATLPEEADVVKLMSIHQAKGLEFPVVFVPDVAAQQRGDRHPVARWHRELGCLVKVPGEFDNYPDEAPFPEFAEKLGRTADLLADWQEDLRILYVACTRARDLLVLSAGIPEPLGETSKLPANHWTLTLAERFDVRTGKCVVPGGPSVRVVMTDGGEVAQVKVPEPSRGDPARAAANPVPLPPPSTPPIISLPALEQLARGETPPALGETFDTEADTDRAHWRSPRERVSPLSPADAVLWAVLDRWDFGDVDGWVQLLADAADELTDADDRTGVENELQPKLRRLAESGVRATLAGAEELHRAVEFLADLREVAEDGSPAFTVRGVIDFLFRDSAGWHVLGVDRGTALEDDPWRGRRAGLVLAAWGVSRTLGEWPASVRLFDLATGQLVRHDPQKFRLATIAGQFAALL
jgi:ATP-dependent helicase/nuclease subunit A